MKTLRVGLALVAAITITSPTFAGNFLPNSYATTATPRYGAARTPYGSGAVLQKNSPCAIGRWERVSPPGGGDYQRNTCTGETKPIIN
jgi:hypothetical protein